MNTNYSIIQSLVVNRSVNSCFLCSSLGTSTTSSAANNLPQMDAKKAANKMMEIKDSVKFIEGNSIYMEMFNFFSSRKAPTYTK